VPTGAGAERRTRWPALRSGRSLDRQGSPANDAGRRASRRSTAAFLAKLSPRRSSGPGFRETGICAGPVQRAPRRAVLMPPGSLPGAARVRGYEPRPQGPHPAPPTERLQDDAPRSSRVRDNIPVNRNEVKRDQKDFSTVVVARFHLSTCCRKGISPAFSQGRIDRSASRRRS
jgi:hypothetical protein